MTRQTLRIAWGPEGAGGPGAAPAVAEPVAPAPPPGEGPIEVPLGYTIVDEPGAPDQKAIQSQLEALANENAALKARQPEPGLAEALGEFRQGLQALADRPIKVEAPKAPGPVIDPEAEDAAIDTAFLEGPTKSVRKIIGREITPAMELLLKSNVAMARTIVRERPAEKGFFTKYPDEIESEFNMLDARERYQDPVAAYERALSVVKGRHLEEIKAEWAASAAAAAPTAAAAAAAPGAPAAARIPLIAGSPHAPPEGGRKITSKELDTVRRYMDYNGVENTERNFEAILANVREGLIR